jgi:hypothetical protein
MKTLNPTIRRRNTMAVTVDSISRRGRAQSGRA